jgi:hypothetical protein
MTAAWNREPANGSAMASPSLSWRWPTSLLGLSGRYCAILKSLGELDVGQIMPNCQQQGIEHCPWRPRRFAFAGRIERLQQASDRGPVDQFGSLSSVDDDRDVAAKLSLS